MRVRRRSEQGSSLIEFTVTGIPLILLLMCTITMSITMWNYHTLEFAVSEGARYATSRGHGCSYTGNSCATTVANVARQVAGAGIGLSPSQMNVTLTSSAGSIVCNPLDTCYTNASMWPPSGANSPGSAITVSATYPSQASLVFLFLPLGGNLRLTPGTLPASSTQIVVF